MAKYVVKVKDAAENVIREMHSGPEEKTLAEFLMKFALNWHDADQMAKQLDPYFVSPICSVEVNQL